LPCASFAASAAAPSRLRMPRHRPDLDEAEAQRGPCGERAAVLVHPGGQPDAVGETQAQDVDRGIGAVDALKRGQSGGEAAHACERGERALVHDFGILTGHAVQRGADDLVEEHAHMLPNRADPARRSITLA